MEAKRRKYFKDEKVCQMLIRRQITKEKTEINDRFDNVGSMVTLTKTAIVGC